VTAPPHAPSSAPRFAAYPAAGRGAAGSAGLPGYRALVLRTVSWLIRAGAYVLIAVDVFASSGSSFGPVALPVTAIAYGLCGVLLAGWALLERRHTATPDASPAGGSADAGWGAPAARVDRTLLLTVLLGLITALSSAVAVQPHANAVVALAVIATIDAGSETRLAAGWAVLGAGVLAVAVGALVTDADTTTALVMPLVLAISLLMGLNRRSYRMQAEQSAVLLGQAEKLRAQQHQVAVLDERTRIAREIHDVLAHSLGALGIQIQAARALLTDHQDTGRAVEVLTVAQRMASDGLGETRRAVHALRTDTPPLDQELARMAATHEQRHGSTVTLTVAGGVLPLPPDQTLALVRAAHESLTNAAKHAPHRPVTVDLLYGDEDVTLTLTNPLGRPDPPEPGGTPDFATVDGGYGLTGMRERLLLLNGTLAAGAAGGRWTVTARVPLAGRGRR
jgi:signal transduction histidine kinase